MTTSDLAILAAKSNAHWCRFVWSTFGLQVETEQNMDVAFGLAPPFYPNVVTSAPGDVQGKLNRISSLVDMSIGLPLAVKDSFCELDLGSLGFNELFTATWLYRPSSSLAKPGGSYSWKRCADAGALASWQKLWISQNPGGEKLDWRKVFTESKLTAETDILFVVGAKDEIPAACAILNFDGSTVGVSNFLVDPMHEGSEQEALNGCLEFSVTEFPEVPIVGYETESSIGVWQRSRFDRVGELRVWVKPV